MNEFGVLILSIIAAIIPAVIYMLIIYWFDRYEKEPLWLLISLFLWGAIPSVIISLIFNTLFSTPLYYLVLSSQMGDALAASLIAPPVEETAKGLALVGIFFLWRQEIDSILDGIIYGAMVGMGFAMVENVFYFTDQFAAGGFEAWSLNVVLRAVVFGLNHSLFSAMTGLGIAVARMSTDRRTQIAAPILGWMASIFLHFVHNASVSFGNLLCLLALVNGWGGVLLMLGIMVWALVQEQRWIKEYLKDEVAAGVLTPQQYTTAVSGRRRVRSHTKQFQQHGLKGYRRSVHFFHRCAELAYKKHHLVLFADDEKTAVQAAEIRADIRQLAAKIK